MANQNSTSFTPEGGIVIVRDFVAPRPLVWKMWTDPEHVAKWYGPKGMQGTVKHMDVRVGGRYHWTMSGPQGQVHHAVGEYREVAPVERLAFTQDRGDEKGNRVQSPMPETVVTVVLDDLGSTTRMTMTHSGIPPGQWAEMAAMGWNQAFDKIEQSL